jgi:hypothetical protein
MTVAPQQSTPDAAPAEELVWHYTDGRGLLSILAGDVLWATASGYLNDTSEVELGNRLVLERFTALADAKNPVFAALRERIAQSDVKQGPSPAWFFILSASATPDSLAMWRSYGGRGESYAIGLDPSADLVVLVDDVTVSERVVVRQHDWMPVRYDGVEQEALVDAVMAELPKGIDAVDALRERGDPSTADYLDAFADTLEAAEQALLLIKHPGFREEQETRRTTTVLGDGRRTDALTGLARFRHTAYGMAPYLRLTGASDAAVGTVTTEPAPLPIRAVAISPTPNGDAAQESLLALLASHGMHDVPVRRSGIPFRG